MWGLVLGACVAGLVGSPHCVGMCGGFAATCANTRTRAGAYHLGRLTTYAALGAACGALGSLLVVPGWPLTVVSMLLVTWFSGSLAGLWGAPNIAVPGIARPAQRLARADDPVSAWAFGALTALLPCGLVYAALSVPIAIASPAWGAAAMVGFGLGTVPLLAAAAHGLQRILIAKPRTRYLVGLLVWLAGAGSVGMRHVAGLPAQDAIPEPVDVER